MQHIHDCNMAVLAICTSPSTECLSEKQIQLSGALASSGQRIRLAALHPPLCNLLVHPHLRLKVAADELSIAEGDLRSTHKPISTLHYAEYWLCRKIDAFARLRMLQLAWLWLSSFKVFSATSQHIHATMCRSDQPCRVFHSSSLHHCPCIYKRHMHALKGAD